MLRYDCDSLSTFGWAYTKIGTIQRRLAWPLRKDDTQNREAFHIFCVRSNLLMEKCCLLWTKMTPFGVLFTKTSQLTLQESEDHEIVAGSIPMEHNEKITW